MSAKQAHVTVTGFEENSEVDVEVTAVVDFLNPGSVYIRLTSPEVSLTPCTIVLSGDDARRLAEFIGKEA